ncbi:MAG: putative ferredoxin reductase [Porticoccaceae bacterium]|nr:MAG: putative ferredoxin reductase [Porticoccaceae bacterium]
MAKERCIIVGASHAAAQLAPTLRQHGYEGSIAVIGDEYFLPYHRPPLSKDFLAGKKSIDDILIRPPAVYQKNNIRFVLGLTVTGIDRANKHLLLDDGEQIPYDKLVLTVGARVRRLEVPGVDKKGIFYLRTLADVQQIKAYAGKARHAVIVGGGYIGLETAASLRKLGMEVVVLEALPRVLARVTAPEVSAFYTRVHAEEGVRIVTDAQVAEFLGDGEVREVALADGRTFPADLVIIGIGIIPNTEMAAEAGLEVDNGIVVDEFARTSDPDILAAGDCTCHFNPIYGRRVRLESVQNAVDQATIAALTLCGQPRPYRALPWFWSDQYDLKLQIAGLSQGYDQVVIRGDIERGRSFAAFYLKEGKLLAVDAVNRPQEFMLGKRLIAEGVEVDPSLLRQENFALKGLLAR